ncbi:hypothetical protein HY024_04385 [Candidatus Curtissbacteria bacterium]|nr:hypothetical protein [Candidatus Curtissbacteria bacterium]
MTTSESILATLAYHDIFDYPLTPEEIWLYQIEKTTSLKAVKKELWLLAKFKKVQNQHNLYSLKSRGAIIKMRLRREKYSKLKLKKAKFYANILKSIPTVSMVGITGALAMQNSDQKDDIDLLVVTSKNSLWSTRLFVNILLYPYRRKPDQPHTNNKACLNIFLTQNNLKVTTQNLYTAHEIAQTKPIWQRGNTYASFIKANSWVKKYLPNWQLQMGDSLKTYQQTEFKIFPEKIAKKLQLSYMKKRITTEKIGDNQLFFHPADTESWVLQEYQKRLKKLR